MVKDGQGWSRMIKDGQGWSRKDNDGGADNTDIEENNERPYKQTYLHEVTQGKKRHSIGVSSLIVSPNYN